MDLTSALQETLNLLKRKEAIATAKAMGLLDLDEEVKMRDKLAFEYAVLRTIYLLPCEEEECSEPSQSNADLLQ